MTAGPGLVGRATEVAAVLAALAAGRHVLLVGPAGVGKTALVRHVCAGRPARSVHGAIVGSAGELTGRPDPPRMHRAAATAGPVARTFVPGPLVAALRAGEVLVLDAVDRLAPDAVAVLAAAMDGALVVPGVGRVAARAGFAVVATATPDRAPGGLPRGFLDRVVRVALRPQPAAADRAVVAAQVPGAPHALVVRAVALVRAARDHPDVADGPSLRAAIDLCAVAGALAGLAGRAVPDDADQARAAHLALSARVALVPGAGRRVEDVLDELWAELLAGERRALPGPGVIRPPSVLTREVRAAPGGPGSAADGPAAPGVGAGPARDGAGAAGTGGAATEGAPAALVARTDTALVDFVATGGRARGAATRPGGAAPSAAEVRRAAVAAARIVVRRLRGTRLRRGPGTRLATVRFDHRGDDLDLDRTVEELAANPFPLPTDLWVRSRVPHRRAVVLILDVSGSMRGTGLVHAATAAAAAALALAGSDELAVVAFWRSTTVLLGPGERAAPHTVAERVLALRPWGLTDVAAGLEAGLVVLGGMRERVRRALVMTDGLHNSGPDPVAVARRFPRLDVLATDPADRALHRCRALAAAGRGTCAGYAGLDELPERLSLLLSG